MTKPVKSPTEFCCPEGLDIGRFNNLVTSVILVVVIILLFRRWDVNVTNPSLPVNVDVTFPTNMDVNVTNSTPIEVTVANTTPIDVDVTFPESLDVTIINENSIDVNVTNSTPIEVTVANTTPLTVVADLEYYEDAFSRIRVSEPYTLGDYKQVYQADPSFIDYTVNGGLVTYNQNESAVTLSLNGTANGRAVHQSRMYHHYMPGKSQFLFSSFVFGAPQVGVTKRTGYFDDREGIYLQQGPDGVLSWNIRSISLATTETKNQSLWLDPCNGSGPSGVSLDFSQTQLIFIDFQWLGVGAVRCGFVHSRRLIVSHIFYHSNVVNKAYLQNPNLPLRCEISCTGGAVGSMNQICGTVISEGGYAESGFDFSINSGYLGRDCDVGGTRYPLLAIRLKNTFKTLPNRVVGRLTNFSVYNENHGILWEVWRLSSVVGQLTGTVTWADVNSDQSAMEYSIFPDGITLPTSAVQITSGFSPAGNANAGNNAISISDPSKARKMTICQNFDSTDSQVFVVVAIPVGTGSNFNANCFASIQWREIY